MRRLFAYLAVCLSIVLGVAFNFAGVINGTNLNYDYDSGREIAYRIKHTDNTNETPISMVTLNSVVSTMEDRLEKHGVSKYQISKEGNDIVRVRLKQDNVTQYSRVRAYLNYDADFSVALGDKDNSLSLAGNDIFTKASVEYVNSFPVVVIDLKDDAAISSFDNLVKEALAIQEEKQGPKAEGEEEAALVEAATIVIWANYDETKDNLADAKAGTDSEMAEKLYMTFDPRHVYFDTTGENKSQIALAMSLGQADQNGRYPIAAVTQANNNANYLANIFNASSYGDYKVDFMFMKTVPASIEGLFNFAGPLTLSLSRTLIAVVVGLALVALILFALEKLPALGMMLSAFVAPFVAMIFYNIIGVDFAASTIVGLVIVFALALFNGLVHAHGLKLEIYKGRSMRKANQEASKKANSPVIDSSILIFILALVTYFLGGSALQGLSTIVMFGALVNLVIVLLLNKLMFYLLTNNTKTATNYKLFGIDESKVPAAGSEKEHYQGRFASRNWTSKHKAIGIGGGVLALASLTLLIVFGAGGKNALNLGGEVNNYTRIYLTVNADTSPISTVSDTHSPKVIIEEITLDGKPITYDTIDVQTKTVTEGEDGDKITVNYNYIVLEFKNAYTGDETVSYVSGGATQTALFKDAIIEVVGNHDSNADIAFAPVVTSSGSPTLWAVSLTGLVTLLVNSVYIVFRFGAARAKSFFITGLITGLATVGFFLITRIAVTPITAVSALVAIGLTSLFASFLFNVENTLRKENPNVSKEENAKHSVGLASPTIILSTLLLVLLSLNLFGLGPYALAWLFVGLTLAGLFTALFTLRLLTPLSGDFAKLLAKLPKFQLRKPKVKKMQNIGKQKGPEPEEAVIIGIND